MITVMSSQGVHPYFMPPTTCLGPALIYVIHLQIWSIKLMQVLALLFLLYSMVRKASTDIKICWEPQLHFIK